jgi:hypothetical protein
MSGYVLDNTRESIVIIQAVKLFRFETPRDGLELSFASHIKNLSFLILGGKDRIIKSYLAA